MVEIRCAERLDNRRLAGRYRLEELIAHGGMADVYRAYDDSLGRRVAVKVYRSGVGDASRARNEMELLTRLQHRHLVRLLDASGDGESDYLILELFEHTLADRIATSPIPADEAAAIGHAVA